MAVQYCGDDFCLPQKNSIDAACHDLGRAAGKQIMYQKPPTCWCICSCVGDKTPITLDTGSEIPIEGVVVGQTRILAAGKDLKFTSTVVGQKSSAPPAKTTQTIFVRYVLDGTNRAIVVTQSHPFFLHNTRDVCAASMLRTSDKLIDRNGNPVTITAIDVGDYMGAFWEIATSLTPPDANYTAHLVLTGGVVSGDFSIETYINYPLGDDEVALAAAAREARPVVGSRAWHAAEAAGRGAAGHLGAPRLEEEIEVFGATFVPAARRRVEIPEHASDFFPVWEAEWLELVAPKRDYNDSYALDMCEWLLDRVFIPAYPQMEFLFDWYSDDPNTRSWVTRGKKFVYLSGGLSRIEGMDYDGVMLALAHEVGHLLGKPDGSPSGVTCQGEADWYGASIVFRNLLFGDQAFAGLQRAIDQVEVLYGYMKIANAAGEQLEHHNRMDKAGRGYPSHACRIETWEKAMSSPTKPACAECGPVPCGKPVVVNEEDLEIAVSAVPPCGDFCKTHAEAVKSACHDLGLPPGKKIIFQVDGKVCYCICP